jgi:hypothetical protein
MEENIRRFSLKDTKTPKTPSNVCQLARPPSLSHPVLHLLYLRKEAHGQTHTGKRTHAYASLAPAAHSAGRKAFS